MDNQLPQPVWDERYDKKDYNQKIFSFNMTELASLSPWDRDVQIGGIAERVIIGFIQGTVLKRLGLKQSVDIGINYSIQENKLYIYEPKVWCSLCTHKKAEYSAQIGRAHV